MILLRQILDIRRELYNSEILAGNTWFFTTVSEHVCTDLAIQVADQGRVFFLYG